MRHIQILLRKAAARHGCQRLVVAASLTITTLLFVGCSKSLRTDSYFGIGPVHLGMTVDEIKASAKVEVNTTTSNLVGPDGRVRQAVDGYFSHPDYFVRFNTTPAAEGAKVMYFEAQRTAGDAAGRDRYIDEVIRKLGKPDVRGIPAFRVAPYFFQEAQNEGERAAASEGQLSLGWAEVAISNGKVIYGASGRGLICDCYRIQRSHNPSMPFICVIRGMNIELWHKYLARND